MSFHHRSQFSGRPKAHKNFGKSKPSAANKVSGRLVPESDSNPRGRKFQSGFDEHHDIGRRQRQATARERRKQHREELLKKKRDYYGKIRGGVPKVIALVPLSQHCDLRKIKRSMVKYTKSSDISEADDNTNAQDKHSLYQPIFMQSEVGSKTINYELFVCERSQWSILDACKVADIVVLVSAPSPDLKAHENTFKALNPHQTQAALAQLASGRAANAANSSETGANSSNGSNESLKDLVNIQGGNGNDVNMDATEAKDGLEASEETDIGETYRSFLLGTDAFSKEICQLVRAQGVPNIMSVYQSKFHAELLQARQVSKKQKNKYKVSKVDKRVLNHLGQLIKYEFGTDIGRKHKILDCYDNEQLFRFLAEMKHCELDWRQRRPHLLAQTLRFLPYPADANNMDSNGSNANNANNANNGNKKRSKGRDAKGWDAKGQLELTGFLRGGQRWNVERAVHITGVGDFRVSRVDGVVLSRPRKVLELPSERKQRKRQERREQNEQNIEKKKKRKDGKNGMDKDAFEGMDAKEKAFLNDGDESGEDNEMEDNDLEMGGKPKSLVKSQNDSMEMDEKTDANDQNVGDFINLVQKFEAKENDPNTEKLRPLDELATAADQSVITEQELKDADDRRREHMLKIMQKKELSSKGLSNYRLDWDELVGWGSDDSDGNNGADAQDSETLSKQLESLRGHGRVPMADDADSEMTGLTQQAAALHIGAEEMADPIEALAAQKRLEHEEMEFPDEVNTPIHMRAKDKFDQYRGLKSFIRTKWDKFELLPVEYSRIFQISDWKRAKKLAKSGEPADKQADRSGMENANNLIECGRKVRVYIENFDKKAYESILNANRRRKVPVLMWGLLEHEHQISVCHFNVSKDLKYAKPVQGLDSYVFDVGFRRFIARPVFSAKSRNDKHLVQKFLKTNEVSVASVYAPIMYPNLPVLMFEHSSLNFASAQATPSVSATNGMNDDNDEKVSAALEAMPDDTDIYDMDLNSLAANSSLARNINKTGLLVGNDGILSQHRPMVANGSLLEVNAHRLLIKRKILTGYPIRVHRRRAVVRYMFWNSDDVRYFQPLDLWTKHGLHGKIEEPVGDKGYMKCFFDGIIKQHDIVCLSLYRRVFPVAETGMFGDTVTAK